MATDPQVLDDSLTAPAEPVLRPVLSVSCALRLRHLVATAAFCALFLGVNHLPLRNTDLWGHVSIGRWIVEHGTLPTQDPVQPLAEGMRYVDSWWVSQVLLAKLEQLAGPEGLCALFAVTVLLTYILLTRSFFLLSGRLSVAMFGALLTLTVGWSRLTTLRPEVFSLLCLAVLLWMLARQAHDCGGQLTLRGPSRLLWIATPLLMTVWSGLHGTFVCGVLFVGLIAAGKFIEVAWRNWSFKAAFADRPTQQWILFAEVVAAASLVNPYGMNLWLEVAAFDKNPVVQAISEWQPLSWRGTGGYEFAVGAVVLVFVLRLSKRSFHVYDGLLLALFTWQALSHHRFLGWLAPALAWILTPHLTDLADRWFPRKLEPEVSPAEFDAGKLPAGRSWRYLMVAVMLVWVTFVFSGLSRPLMGGTPRGKDSLYSDMTPWRVTEYLRQHPPKGQIYNPQWWGDWLVWDGPANLRVFATTNLHVLPRQVWADHQRVSMVEAGWEGVFDRYNIETAVIDKKVQPVMIRIMRRSPEWTPRYEDDQAIVFTRNPRNPPEPTAPVPSQQAGLGQ
ncbi:MAG: hypothetical protein JSS27_16200 [Planctomycetes bacterium]|nr:hypothetical protein [Planctomycetota bacterium]